MAILAPMPQVNVPTGVLLEFGQQWTANGGSLSRTPPFSSSQLGRQFDDAVGSALAVMLGGIPVVEPLNSNALVAPMADCVEVGATRTIGGIRPQNFDVCYRPDGVRFAFDSKTLNDLKSVRKNYQNMINDLATEATTIHVRFPHALVAFIVIVPAPCLLPPQREVLIGTLDRLARRTSVNNQFHLAEALSLVVWEPETGEILPNVPALGSRLRLEMFPIAVQSAYFSRYEGFPPHAA
ncbi:MAG: hypothetical protein ABSC77_05235 [Terracidiphilus sp.]|jgi:hypothetical protein